MRPTIRSQHVWAHQSPTSPLFPVNMSQKTCSFTLENVFSMTGEANHTTQPSSYQDAAFGGSWICCSSSICRGSGVCRSSGVCLLYQVSDLSGSSVCHLYQALLYLASVSRGFGVCCSSELCRGSDVFSVTSKTVFLGQFVFFIKIQLSRVLVFVAALVFVSWAGHQREQAVDCGRGWANESECCSEGYPEIPAIIERNKYIFLYKNDGRNLLWECMA